MIALGLTGSCGRSGMRAAFRFCESLVEAGRGVMPGEEGASPSVDWSFQVFPPYSGTPSQSVFIVRQTGVVARDSRNNWLLSVVPPG